MPRCVGERRAGGDLADDDDADRGPGCRARIELGRSAPARASSPISWTLVSRRHDGRDDHERHQCRVGDRASDARRARSRCSSRRPTTPATSRPRRQSSPSLRRRWSRRRLDAAGGDVEQRRWRARCRLAAAPADCRARARRDRAPRAAASAPGSARPIGLRAGAEAASRRVEPQRLQLGRQRRVGAGDAIDVRWSRCGADDALASHVGPGAGGQVGREQRLHRSRFGRPEDRRLQARRRLRDGARCRAAPAAGGSISGRTWCASRSGSRSPSARRPSTPSSAPRVKAKNTRLATTSAASSALSTSILRVRRRAAAIRRSRPRACLRPCAATARRRTRCRSPSPDMSTSAPLPRP